MLSSLTAFFSRVGSKPALVTEALEKQTTSGFSHLCHLLPDHIPVGNARMRLSMNNIHSPTVVPSGPTTIHSGANGAPQEKTPLMDLIAEKTRVEEELKALGGVLDSVCFLCSGHRISSTFD